MVVMITLVSFSSIKWKTYLGFAVINAAMVPVVFFFYPETAYRKCSSGLYRINQHSTACPSTSLGG